MPEIPGFGEFRELRESGRLLPFGAEGVGVLRSNGACEGFLHAITRARRLPSVAGNLIQQEGCRVKGTSGRWKPGMSGNPRGRKPGSGEVAKLRAAIAEHVPGIVAQLVEAAQAGDVQAARLLLERVIPPVKAAEVAQPVALAGETLTAQGRAVLAAVAAGELAPGQGAALLGALGTLAKLAETDELEARIAVLEGRRHGDA